MIFDRLTVEEDTAERFVANFRRTNGVTIFGVLLEGILGAFMLYISIFIGIFFLIVGLIACAGVVLYIVARMTYWRRLVIDSVNKSILAEGNFSKGTHLIKSTSTTFDGIKYIQIIREGNASTIYVNPREGPNILAAQSISLDQADFLKEQFERRTGLQVGKSYAS